MNDFNHQDKNNSLFDKIKASFTGRKFRSGVYVSVISAIVITLVLVVNLILSEFDLKVDLSKDAVYTLTDATEDYVKQMEDEVTIYYLIEPGKGSPYFENIAEKFDSLSDRITLAYKDPIQYPAFSKDYVDDEVTQNSFLVINNSNNRAKYIDSADMLVQEFDYNAMDYITVGIDVEGKLISAIQYVTNPDLPTVYVTAGHEEYATGKVFQDIMNRMNVTVKSIQTMTAPSIPEDCDILFINAPKSDFSKEEIEMIKNYMTAGGNAVIVMDYVTESFENLNSLVNYYGIRMEQGIVFEGDTNRHAPSYPQYIVPEVLEHDITGSLAKTNRLVVTPQSSGFEIMDTIRKSLIVKPLLQTSKKAYSKVNLTSTTLVKEEEDIEGPFYLGLAASDTFEGVTSNLVLYTSEFLFDDNFLNQYGNLELLIGTVGYLSGDIETISVRPRYIFPEALNIAQKPALFWGAYAAILVPSIILTAGIIVCIRRRRR